MWNEFSAALCLTCHDSFLYFMLRLSERFWPLSTGALRPKKLLMCVWDIYIHKPTYTNHVFLCFCFLGGPILLLPVNSGALWNEWSLAMKQVWRNRSFYTHVLSHSQLEQFDWSVYVVFSRWMSVRTFYKVPPCPPASIRAFRKASMSAWSRSSEVLGFLVMSSPATNAKSRSIKSCEKEKKKCCHC